jgi:hypothetical protein
MSTNKWTPEDNFYNGYSLYHYFGYGPEGELNLTANMLQKEGFPDDPDLVKATLELTRDLSNKILRDCKPEIREYEVITKRKIVVGGVIPAHIQLAKAFVI